MVQINFARREVNCKIVFYGPGLSGKTTNLEIIHKKVPQNARGQLTSIATEQDRTLFFDFMPLDLGTVAGMKTKLFLYTVPGQVYYNSTRKLVLQGADGIAFVADSDPNRMNDNIESLRDLEDNLKEYGIDIRRVPVVIQYNKRDLPGAMPVADMTARLNPYGFPTFEAVAVKGDGVMQTLKGISRLVIDKLNEDYAPGKAVTPGGSAKSPSQVLPAQAERPKSGMHASPVAKPKTSELPAAKPVEAAAKSRTSDPSLGLRSKPVEPAPPPRTPPPPPPPRPVERNPMPGVQPPPPKGGSKTWLWIVLILLLLGGGGAAWYFKFGGKQMIEKQRAKPPETPAQP